MKERTLIIYFILFSIPLLGQEGELNVGSQSLEYRLKNSIVQCSTEMSAKLDCINVYNTAKPDFEAILERCNNNLNEEDINYINNHLETIISLKKEDNIACFGEVDLRQLKIDLIEKKMNDGNIKIINTQKDIAKSKKKQEENSFFTIIFTVLVFVLTATLIYFFWTKYKLRQDKPSKSYRLLSEIKEVYAPNNLSSVIGSGSNFEKDMLPSSPNLPKAENIFEEQPIKEEQKLWQVENEQKIQAERARLKQIDIEQQKKAAIEKQKQIDLEQFIKAETERLKTLEFALQKQAEEQNLKQKKLNEEKLKLIEAEKNLKLEEYRLKQLVDNLQKRTEDQVKRETEMAQEKQAIRKLALDIEEQIEKRRQTQIELGKKEEWLRLRELEIEKQTKRYNITVEKDTDEIPTGFSRAEEFNIQDVVFFYMSIPSGNSRFEINSRSEIYIQSRVFYRFFTINNKIAFFELCNDPNSVKKFLDNSHTHLLPVCVEFNKKEDNVKGIRTRKKGKAHLEDTQWIVDEKAQIEYLY